MSTSITPDTFTSLLIDFRNLPGSGAALVCPLPSSPEPQNHTISLQGNGTWDRITWQAGANGDIYHIDNIVVVESIVIPPLFLSAEPLAANTIAVTTQGDVDFSTFAVSLNGQVNIYFPNPDNPCSSIIPVCENTEYNNLHPRRDALQERHVPHPREKLRSRLPRDRHGCPQRREPYLQRYSASGSIR